MRICLFLLVLLISCSNPTTTTQNNTTGVAAPSKSAVEAAVSQSNVSASTMQNLTTGYWHIGGAVNVPTQKAEKGTEGYVGKWIKFNTDMTYTHGKDDKDINSGTWLFNEKGEYLTIVNEKDDAFFLNEWNTRFSGDIVLLIGNSPKNPKSGQIKLVRQDAKVIEHNPN